MADKQLSLNLEIGTAKATKSLKDAAKEAKKLGTELEDSRTAGKKLADSIGAVADEMESEFKQATKAAGKLEQALGEDGVAAIKKQGKSIDELVQDLKRAGLAYDDIEADVDELAASIKRMSAVGDQIDTHITKNMEGVARATDQSRSVMANYTGNAIQELPGVAGAFGPLNMAIGQFTEYATEGNIAVKNLITTGLGIAGLAIGMNAYAKNAERAKKATQWKHDQIDAFVESIRNGEDAAIAFAKRLREAGKVEIKTGGVLDEIIGGNVTGALAKGGVTADQFAMAVTHGEEGLELLSNALKAAGVDSETATTIMFAATEQQKNYNQAIKTAAEVNKVFGSTAKENFSEVYRRTRDVAEAFEDMAEGWAELNDAIDSETSFQELMLSLDELPNKLTEIDEAYRNGEITAEEALRQTRIELNKAKTDAHKYLEALGFPPEVATKIDLAIDAGDEARAKALLATLERIRTAMGQVGWFGTNQGKSSTTPGKMQAKARGGRAEGLTLVGEEGPELVDLPKGSYVHTASETRNMGNGPNITIYAPSQSPESLYAAIERYNRRNGL